MNTIILVFIALFTILFFVSLFIDGLLSDKPDLDCWVGQKLEKIRPYHKKIKTFQFWALILTIIFCVIWVIKN